MNRLLLLALLALIVSLFFRKPAERVVIYHGSSPAKCYGYNPCSACTSCNYCAHCNAGGTCGVCKASAKKQDSVVKTPAVSQCKAITKKGTRCSRSAKVGGYCWQHGG